MRMVKNNILHLIYNILKMEQNISMIRFLMFIILALIIFFNIAPQLIFESKIEKKDYNSDVNGNDSK